MAARKPYDFKMEKTTGEETTFSPTMLLGSSTYGNNNIRMCPYTELIPLSYILRNTDDRNMYCHNEYGNTLARNWGAKFNEDSIKAFDNRWTNRVFSVFVNPNKSREEGKDLAGIEFEKWMRRDSPCNLNIYGVDGGIAYRDRIINNFNISRHNTFQQNSYSGAIGPYSLFRRETLQSIKPEMLAVVIPENYLYIKLHLLVYNTIPLDRVIVLINKDLDRTDYPIPAFRSLYRALLPKVMRSSCQVWKVPQQFIMDSCFISNYRLKETNIVKREEEISALIDEFYREFGELPSSQLHGEISGNVLRVTGDLSSSLEWTNTSSATTNTVVYHDTEQYVSGNSNRVSVSSPFNAENTISTDFPPVPSNIVSGMIVEEDIEF